MDLEHVIVAATVGFAAAWLAYRAWVRARNRYRSGPCCGEGCGCKSPLIFGSKKKRARR